MQGYHKETKNLKYKFLVYIGITIAISLMGAVTAQGATTLYISPDGTNLGVSCTSSGDNVAGIDAIYLMASTTDINTPSTGFDTPNPVTTCPDDIVIYGPDGVLDPRSGLISNGFGDEALRLKIDPTGFSANIYEYFYLNTCESVNIWTLTNSCEAEEPPVEPDTISATSTTDQIQQNMLLLWFIFMSSFMWVYFMLK